LTILNKILSSKDLSFVHKNSIPAEYFIQYKTEFDFIQEHFCKYNCVPDKTTFVAKFNDFEFVEVTESEQYMLETLQEQYTYSKLVPCVKKIAELVLEDANKAVTYARTELENIRKISTLVKPGVDIVQSFSVCADEYKRRIETKGLLGISSGIKEIDEATHGWIYPDVIDVLGRLNEGKSWLVFLFLINAWAKGVPVGLYSGEMERLFLQMRMAALHGHFSNLGLMSGNSDLKNGKSFADFFKYAADITGNKTPFIVLTPKDLRSKKATVSELRNAIETYGLKLLGVDQISLMEDERYSKGDQKRIGLTNISEDLYNLSADYQIPIIVAVQASRQAVEGKEKKDKAPEMEDISESDGIGQNATRTLALKQVDDRLILALRKNRYGLRGQEWRLKWDVDTGDIGFLAADQFQPAAASSPAAHLAKEDIF
jgi:replicative DNA helicase